MTEILLTDLCPWGHLNPAGVRARVQSILAALLYERRDGPVWADVSEYECAVVGQFEALLSCAADGQEVRPQGNRGPFGELTDCFEGAQPDRWIAVSIPEPESLPRPRDLARPARRRRR